MTAAIGGDGFHIATGFLKIVADQRKAEKDTERFIRDTDRRMEAGGRSAGLRFGSGFAGALRGHLAQVFGGVRDLFEKSVGGALQLSKLGAMAGVVASAVGGLASAVASLIPALGELVQVAAAASGSLLLLPAALVAVGGALVTAKIGMKGFGDAVKALNSGDAKKINAALAKLAPSAALAARAVSRLKPAFDQLRLKVQSALFTDMAATLSRLGRTYLPVLTTGFTGLAFALNTTVRNVVDYLAQRSTALDWSGILARSAGSIQNLGTALRPLLRVFTDVSAVGSVILEQITARLGPALDGFANRVSGLRASGGLADIINNGLDALKQFGALLVDVGGIIHGVFKASGEGGFFSFFDRLNKLINSVSGQSSLTQIFASLGDIGKSLTPVLELLLAALVPVADAVAKVAAAFAPSLMTLVNGLAAGITALVPGISALAPVFDVLGKYLPVVGKGLSDLLVGFAPGLVAGLNNFGYALGLIAKDAKPLGDALGTVLYGVSTLLPPLVTILSTLITTVAPGVTQFLVALAHGLADLAPAAAPVGDALSGVFKALAPILPVLGDAIAKVLPPILGLITALMPLVDPVVKLLVPLGNIISVLALALAPIIALLSGPFMKVITDLVTTVGTALMPVFVVLGAALGEVLKAAMPFVKIFADVLGKVFVALAPVISALAATIGKILVAALDALGPVFEKLLPVIADLAMALLPALVPLIDLVGKLFLALMPALVPVIDLLVKILVPLLQYILVPAIKGVTTVLGWFIQGLTWIITPIAKFIGWLAKILGAAETWKAVGKFFTDLWADIKKGFMVGVTWLGGIPGKILGALSGFGTLLLDAGKNLIKGLIDGIKSQISNIGHVMSDLAQEVSDHWPWSPAKKGPLSGRGDLKYAGRNVVARIGEGMLDGRAGLSAVMNQVAAMLAFQGNAQMALAGGGGGFGGGTGSPVEGGDTHVHVYLGQKPLDDLVEGVLVSRPRKVASAAAEGQRQLNFGNTGRRR